jgi:Calx-beta domain
VTVARTGSASSAISTGYSTANGTASSGAQYGGVSGKLQWAENDSTTRSISVPINGSPAFSGSKSFSVSLTDPSNGALVGSPGTATVSISGTLPVSVGTLQLADSTYSVSQSAKSVTIAVDRTDGSTGATSVAYATSDDTASAGTDYTAARGVLNWADGDTATKTITVAISNTAPFVGKRIFLVTLSSATSGASIGNPDSTTVSIVGDASPPVGTLQLANSTYTVSQSAGTLVVSVLRVGGSAGAASVAYSTASGTAVAGADFTTTSGILQWTDADSAPKTFAIPVSDAKPFLGNRTFTVTLSSPSAGTSIQSPGSATVTIAGNASPPIGSFVLSASSYSASQIAGAVNVTVIRTGGSYGAASVTYATNNGTAVSGQDFTATNGTLQWADGDTSARSFTIGISSVAPFSGNKSFSIALTNPSAGAAVGSPQQATVTIQGSGVSSPPPSTGTFWVYYNGVFNWGGDYSSGAVPNYQSTAGNPESGPYDIAMTLIGPFGLWAPYAGGTVPTWDFNASGYTYLTIDLQPTVPNQVWQLYFMQVGDVRIIGPNGQRTVVNVADYGPAPQVGKWATYRIPLSMVLTQYASGQPVYETSVYKFGVQDQTGLFLNTWYIDNVGFTN